MLASVVYEGRRRKQLLTQGHSMLEMSSVKGTMADFGGYNEMLVEEIGALNLQLEHASHVYINQTTNPLEHEGP